MKLTAVKLEAFIMQNSFFKERSTSLTELCKHFDADSSLVFPWLEKMAKDGLFVIEENEDFYVMPTMYYQHRYIDAIVEIAIESRLNNI